jgi:hypothetical protein
MIHADTDRLLDRCQCGAVRQVEESYNDSMEFRATCTECDSKTRWFPTKDGCKHRVEPDAAAGETQTKCALK